MQSAGTSRFDSHETDTDTEQIQSDGRNSLMEQEDRGGDSTEQRSPITEQHRGDSRNAASRSLSSRSLDLSSTGSDATERYYPATDDWYRTQHRDTGLRVPEGARNVHRGKATNPFDYHLFGAGNDISGRTSPHRSPVRRENDRVRHDTYYLDEAQVDYGGNIPFTAYTDWTVGDRDEHRQRTQTTHITEQDPRNIQAPGFERQGVIPGIGGDRLHNPQFRLQKQPRFGDITQLRSEDPNEGNTNNSPLTPMQGPKSGSQRERYMPESWEKVRRQDTPTRIECDAESLQDADRQWYESRDGRKYQAETNSRSGQNYGRPNIMPSPFDGTSNWDDYVIQFELIAEINGWPDTRKALFLAASLKGQARAILSDLDSAKRRDYNELTAALARRFSPANQTQLFRAMLKNRSRQSNESLAELAQEIKRLALRAYPDAPYEMVDTLAKEYFIDSLVDTDTKWRVYQSRPGTLSDAVVVAVELEAFHLAEIKKGTLRRPTVRAVAPTETPTEKVEHQIKLLGETLNKTMQTFMEKIQSQFTTKQTDTRVESRRLPVYPRQDVREDNNRQMQNGDWQRPPPKCWGCGKLGHIKRYCPDQLTPREIHTTKEQGNYQGPDLRVEGRQ